MSNEVGGKIEYKTAIRTSQEPVVRMEILRYAERTLIPGQVNNCTCLACEAPLHGMMKLLSNEN